MEVTKARYNYRPPRPPKRRFRLVAAGLMVLLLVLGSGGYTYAALNRELPQPVLTAAEIPAALPSAPSVSWPGAGQSAIGSVEQGLLATSTTELPPRPIASMTKIVTALTVLKHAPVEAGQSGDSYTINAADTALYRSYLARQGSVVPVSEGQVITQAQALEYVLVISANNLADTMVLKHFGSMETYLAEANKLVKEYGMTRTTIADASGFSPQTVSTAADLIVLGIKALENPLVAGIIKKPSITVPGYGVVKNSNQLLPGEGILGIKTGTTDEAGRCLLFAASHQADDVHEVTIIGVVMGSPSNNSLYAAARKLLDDAKAGFGEIELIRSGTRTASVSTAWGATADYAVTQDLKIFGWKGKPPGFRVEHAEPSLPLRSGDIVGRVITANSRQSVDIVSQQSIDQPSSWWKLTNM